MNLTPEQTKRIIEIVVTAFITTIIAVLGILGYNIGVIQPQFAQIHTDLQRIEAQAFPKEPAPGELGVRATAPIRMNSAGNRWTFLNGSAQDMQSGSYLYSSNSDTVWVNDSITVTGSSKVGTFAKFAPADTRAVTQGGTITPLGTYQTITSTAAITAATVATTTFSAGDFVTLINANASNAITLTNSSTLALPGATDLALGTKDVVGLWFDGSKWIAIFASNN